MRVSARKRPVALTIAGSDSGGGAGIQADLKAFSCLGVFGTSAITCLTAQNPDSVTGVAPAPRGFIAKQIRAVLSAFPVAAAKTGMLYSAAIIREVARELEASPLKALVVDPVAIATSGASLLKPGAKLALISELLPLASVVTPNAPEAEMILGESICSSDDQIAAARAISRDFGVSCLLKGGHIDGNTVFDVLCHKGTVHKVEAPRIRARETHGTGCTLSAALTACLAKGMTVPAAFRASCAFVQSALQNPFRTGLHFPLGIG